jgi:ribose transport system permease protein
MLFVPLAGREAHSSCFAISGLEEWKRSMKTGETGPSNSQSIFVPTRARQLVSEYAELLGLVAAILVTVVFFSIASPYFLDLNNFYNIGRAVSVFGIVAAVSTIVLISGGLDLSLSAVIALGGVVAAQAVGATDSTLLGLLAAVAVGILAGLFNALLIVKIGINPLIATIGTQFAIRGGIFMWTGAIPVSVFRIDHFMILGNGSIVGIPIIVLILFAVFVIVGLLMHFTRFGSRIYAIGGSEVAATLAGIAVGRLRVGVYTLSAVSAACAGALLASVNGAAYPSVGLGAELTILSAVILGGTALTGGRGTVVGTCLGIFLLGTLNNGLNLLGTRAEAQMLAQGVVLILAVTFDEYRRRRSGAL